MNNEIISGHLYKHYKGDTYKIITIAKHTETKETFVIYERQTDLNRDGNRIWARPMDMFLEKVNIDGQEINRFTLINE